LLGELLTPLVLELRLLFFEGHGALAGYLVLGGRLFILVILGLEGVVTLLDVSFVGGGLGLDLLHLGLFVFQLDGEGLLLLFKAGYLAVLPGKFHSLPFDLLSQFAAHCGHILLLLFELVVMTCLDGIGFLFELFHMLLEVFALLGLETKSMVEVVLNVLVFTQLIVELVLQLLQFLFELFPRLADLVLQFVRGDR
jgi:hypothetical protein